MCLGRSTAPCGSDILQYYAGQDATQVWEMANHSARAKEMMASYFVGNYMDPELEVVQVRSKRDFTQVQENNYRVQNFARSFLIFW